MSVDTKKLREQVAEWAAMWSPDHAASETFGIRGTDLLRLCDAYEQLAAMTALATEFANRLAGHAHPAVLVADLARIDAIGKEKP